MTSPLSTTQAAAEPLHDLIHKLVYATYSWGFEAGKVGQHVDTTIAANKADAALKAVLAASPQAKPAAEPTPDKLCGLWFDEWELILPQDARESFRNDLIPSIRAASSSGSPVTAAEPKGGV